jgi:hypothetical protein
VVRALEGDEEAEVVQALLALRDRLAQTEREPDWEAQAEGARARVINLVNTFFYDRLTALPTIKDYMDRVGGAAQ